MQFKNRYVRKNSKPKEGFEYDSIMSKFNVVIIVGTCYEFWRVRNSKSRIYSVLKAEVD